MPASARAKGALPSRTASPPSASRSATCGGSSFPTATSTTTAMPGRSRRRAARRPSSIGETTTRCWAATAPAIGSSGTRPFSRGWVRRRKCFEAEVLHLPGHTPGLVCLWAPGKRVLLLGRPPARARLAESAARSRRRARASPPRARRVPALDPEGARTSRRPPGAGAIGRSEADGHLRFELV